MSVPFAVFIALLAFAVGRQERDWSGVRARRRITDTLNLQSHIASLRQQRPWRQEKYTGRHTPRAIVHMNRRDKLQGWWRATEPRRWEKVSNG
jgi:hypothetical protein